MTVTSRLVVLGWVAASALNLVALVAAATSPSLEHHIQKRAHHKAAAKHQDLVPRSADKPKRCKPKHKAPKKDAEGQAPPANSGNPPPGKKTTLHTSSSAPPAPAYTPAKTTTSSVSGHKAGLGWTDNKSFMPQFASGISWCYSWSPWPCSTLPSVESIPMYWSDKQLASWQSQVVKPGKHWPHVFSVNEPEITGQSNISPDAAISIWHNHIATVNAGARGSPAVTVGDAGYKWMVEYMGKCKSQNCMPDFMCLHYYGTSSADFIARVTKFYKTFGIRIWVTEWACQDYSGRNQQCSMSQTTAFLRETKDWLEQTSWIDRYAWYGAFTSININPTNLLMTSGGTINELGKIYIGKA